MNKMASQDLWQQLYCSALSFPTLECGESWGGNSQLQGLSSFLIPLNKSGVSWFNGNFVMTPHRATRWVPNSMQTSIVVYFLKPSMLYEFELRSIASQLNYLNQAKDFNVSPYFV
jgi:hypothetical protein